MREGTLTPLAKFERQAQLKTWVPLAVERALRKKSRASGQTVSGLIRDILQQAVK